MMKFINNYQLALYLKGKASPKDIQRYLYLYGWDDSYKDIKWIYDYGMERIAVIAMLNPDMQKKLRKEYYGWYSEDEGEKFDPDYDDFAIPSTKVLAKILKTKWSGEKFWIDLLHPEEIKSIYKGGRWRNKGKATKKFGVSNWLEGRLTYVSYF